MAKKKSGIILIMLMMAFCFVLSLFGGINFANAEDATTTYSTVLEDLQKDEAFNSEVYPLIENDYSLQVIQLAESSDKELFIYVYQPSGETKNLIATEIRMSTGINDNAKWEDYSLKLISSNGVFYKYKLENFVVKNDALRYYDLSAIFRKWDENIDSTTDGDNSVDYVSYAIGYLWTVCTIDGRVCYNSTKIDVVEITGKYVGYIRYTNGSIWHTDACDSHFVAFSTNYEIDTLLEADVDYVSQSFATASNGGSMIVSLDEDEEVVAQASYDYGGEVNNTVTIKYDEEKTISVGNIFRKKYSFKRIETVAEFKANEDYDLSAITLDALEGKEWVLRFAETDYEFDYNVGAPIPTMGERGTKVKEVTIMRLKFETNGVVYNLGVVDNKQTGGDVPSGKTPYWYEEYAWFITLIIVALLIVILAPVLPYVFKLVGWIFKAIWWVITLPFEIFKD